MRLFDYRRKRRRRHHSYVFRNGYKRMRRQRGQSGSRRRRSSGLYVAAVIVLVLVFLLGGSAGAFFYLRDSGRRSLREAAKTERPVFDELEEESGLVSRNGKKYRYNEDMVNILCMGIDKSRDVSRTETEAPGASGENGQADAIFLLTLNQEKHTMKLIGISRDTMTEIRTYDHQGNYVGESTNHLGLAYAFGDGRSLSGELMTDAVSGLFYGLPIHGYAAINLNAIQKLNDSVGGVTVTLPEDMVLGGQSFPAGKSLTLDGPQAHSFVRSRDTEQEGSNNLRMARQKQYALAFVGEARKALKKKPTLAAGLYQDLTEDMVTSIGLDEAVYLASLLPGLSFQEGDILMLAGDTRQGAVYEEFYSG